MNVNPVLALIVGAFGASFVGLLGAWIQSRREHSRWLREQRMAAYDEFLRAAKDYPRLNTKTGAVIRDGEEFRERIIDYRRAVRNAMASIEILGPDAVCKAAASFEFAAFERRRMDEAPPTFAGVMSFQPEMSPAEADNRMQELTGEYLHAHLKIVQDSETALKNFIKVARKQLGISLR